MLVYFITTDVFELDNFTGKRSTNYNSFVIRGYIFLSITTCIISLDHSHNRFFDSYILTMDAFFMMAIICPSLDFRHGRNA